jgi:putative transposase
MPRQSRIDTPGALHHIICRGIERSRIFRDNKDRNNFLDRLGSILLETGTPCYAFALMPNHFHLLVRTGNVPVSTVMRRLLTGYAVSFNRCHKRSGHLFQNRYKSILCQEETYLLELVRYIHLNPLRAGIVPDLKTLSAFAYCGHSRIMGNESSEWQDVDKVLGLFGKRKDRARKQYEAFVEKGISEGKKPELTGGGLVRSAGGWQELKVYGK